MKRALQMFDDEYLQRCKGMTPDQILKFLDDFTKLHASQGGPQKLISLRVPLHLLESFKKKAELQNISYQAQIKTLMKKWILSDS